MLCLNEIPSLFQLVRFRICTTLLPIVPVSPIVFTSYSISDTIVCFEFHGASNSFVLLIRQSQQIFNWLLIAKLVLLFEG